MASSAVVGGSKTFSAIIRQHKLNTVSSQGQGPLCWHSCLHASTASWETSFRWSPPKRWGIVYMTIGRPLGATAFLLLRIRWVFHKCATCCSSSCREKIPVTTNMNVTRPILSQYDVCRHVLSYGQKGWVGCGEEVFFGPTAKCLMIHPVASKRSLTYPKSIRNISSATRPICILW